MGDARGFMKHGRHLPDRRPVPVRLRDWKEVYEPFDPAELAIQASRCMDCGIPFCNNGCPLGNLIPDWNDLVYRDHWREAIERLHATNNFPEFTGRLCPAPCEAACVLGINQDPVTIKQVEVEIIERAFAEGWVEPHIAEVRSGKSIAVVGSGPAGLAAAQQLTRAGHDVVVLERADRIGGLLRYGIPEFKMEKRFIDRRLDQMRAEGTRFETNVDVGVDVTAEQLRADYDAVVLACGATQWRDLPIPGRELDGIYQAMEFLPPANRVQMGDLDEHPFSARGKHVIIIGGGDTGADCLGTSHRHGAASVHQFEIMPEPPQQRADSTPWPTWPLVHRVSSAHEEGGERVYSVNTTQFVGENGAVTGLETVQVEQVVTDGQMRFEPVEGSESTFPADLVLLAMGFTGPEKSPLLDEFGVELDGRGNVARDDRWMTNVDGVFVAGDMGRGQSLIVWAIAEGRACASAVDAHLMGNSLLPAPLDTHGAATPLRPAPPRGSRGCLPGATTPDVADATSDSAVEQAEIAALDGSQGRADPEQVPARDDESADHGDDPGGDHHHPEHLVAPGERPGPPRPVRCVEERPRGDGQRDAQRREHQRHEDDVDEHEGRRPDLRRGRRRGSRARRRGTRSSGAWRSDRFVAAKPDERRAGRRSVGRPVRRSRPRRARPGPGRSPTPATPHRGSAEATP